MRAFLAIPVVAPALDALLLLRQQLVADLDGVRWAPIDSAHITLHFLGALTEEQAALALRELRPVIAAGAPITLRLAGLGSFPSEARPRVLWCGVDGEIDALRSVVERSASVLESAGVTVDHRDQRPHCTLGRPRQPWPRESIERWRGWVARAPRTPAFSADVAILYESVSRGGGVRHLARARLPLRGRGGDVQ